MKTIKQNIVGLLSWIMLLILLFIGVYCKPKLDTSVRIKEVKEYERMYEYSYEQYGIKTAFRFEKKNIGDTLMIR